MVKRFTKRFYRVNDQIRASQVRLIDAEGRSLGVFSPDLALKRAKEQELDLVEVAPNVSPPVVKLIKFSKFLYQEEKRQRQKRGTKSGQLKEVRFSPFIANNDYNVRIIKIQQFLGEGNKVRVVVKFKAREMGKREFGYNLIKRVISDLGNVRQESEPRFLGRHLITTITYVKGEKHEKENEN